MKTLLIVAALSLTPTEGIAGPQEDLQCAAYFTYAAEASHRSGDLTNERAYTDATLGLIARALTTRSRSAIDAGMFQAIEEMRYRSRNLENFGALQEEFASPCAFLTRNLG